MKPICSLSTILVCLSLFLAGCSGSDNNDGNPNNNDPGLILVANQNSGDISSVDYQTGAVTSDLGGIELGPTANRLVVRGARAYVVDSGAFPGATVANVKVIDLSNKTVINTIPFPDGDNPWAIAFVSDTKAYVTTLYGNNVTIINPTLSGAAAILDTIGLPEFPYNPPDKPPYDVPAGPEGIVVSAGYAYTANTAWDGKSFSYLPGSVSVIDTATDSVVDVDGLPGNGLDTPIFTSQINPTDLAVDAEGQINVLCTGDYFSQFGVLDVIDPGTWTIHSVALGGSPGILSASSGWAVAGASDMDSCDAYVVNTADNTVVRDSSNPLALISTSSWCTTGKIAFAHTGDGLKAYVPAGAAGAEAALLELAFTPAVQVSRSFNLAPEADLPAAAGVVY